MTLVHRLSTTAALGHLLTAMPVAGATIWRASLRLAPETLFQLTNALRPEERSRIQLLRTSNLRARALAGRALLRLLIGSYLECAPDLVQFEYGPHGRPEVSALRLQGLDFNLAHAGSQMVIAIGGGRLGIDLEPLGQSLEDLPPRLMSVRERALLEQLPVVDRPLAILRCFLLKEAIGKATGEGLGSSSRVETEFRPGRPIGYLDSTAHAEVFNPEPGFLGVLARI
jgi:4'-phosphopantetheinyl transferase